ncbi:TetR/AcrR family transcriptional regulator [Rhizohabitans arisaemae]|uniref:TetR/AcrR family transcriptional regulator n=1 Tax=Rhizohabitans arisaemae TaxID=2720610 RepID=UPI0024B117A1|nr:TetR/AcrR family transcriptional regulator [Rhizohabitans arisaemae]
MPRVSQKPGILAAALSCFAELGYDATRVKHIAERAGVAESALYRHYPSKEAIAQELFTHHTEQHVRRLTAVASADRAPLDRVAATVREILRAYRDQPDAIVFTLLSTGSFLPRLPEGTRYPIEIVEGLITDGQRAGVIRDGRPNLLAAILMGCVLRPIIVSVMSRQDALDLLHDTEHDRIIEEAAIAAVRK